MTSQTLESNFQKAIKSKSRKHTIIKLQVNEHAHNSMPGDYWIQNQHNEIIVECKEVNCNIERKTKPVFDIQRFTQEYKMKKWQDDWFRNEGYLFVVFWYGRIKNSSSYLIPLDLWLERKPYLKKRCLSEIDMNNIFADCLDNNWELEL